MYTFLYPHNYPLNMLKLLVSLDFRARGFLLIPLHIQSYIQQPQLVVPQLVDFQKTCVQTYESRTAPSNLDLRDQM